MKVELNEIGSFKMELSISVPWEECAPDYEKALNKLRRKIKLPGFRPGKVPKQVLEKQYQPLIEAEFLEINIQSYYQKALKSEKQEPINQAEVSAVDFKYGQTLSFKASFEIEPIIQLPKLKKNKLRVVKPVYETDEKDIELTINEFQRSYTKVETVENGAEIGDYILCDLQETDSSGNPLIGRKIEKQYLKVGDSHLSEETNRKLEAIKPGDERGVTLQSGEIKTQYIVKAINIERHILPELNMEFISQIDPEVSDVEEWKGKIAKAIQTNYEAKSEEKLSEGLIDEMISFVGPEYPESMMDGYLDSLVENVKESGEQVKDEEKLREMLLPSAIRNLKYYLIRKAIIKDQDVSISSDEIDEEIKARCEANPQKSKDISLYYRKPSNKKRLSDDLTDRKVTDYLKQFAKVSLETIKTSDLRKKELEHTHDH